MQRFDLFGQTFNFYVLLKIGEYFKLFELEAQSESECIFFVTKFLFNIIFPFWIFSWKLRKPYQDIIDDNQEQQLKS